MPKGMQFSRRRRGITNYRKRLALLKSGIPRAVVRFSNAKITVQIIDFSKEGDKVLASATSNDVASAGWKGSKTNIPASYLSGIIAAKKALKAGTILGSFAVEYFSVSKLTNINLDEINSRIKNL